MNRLTVEEINLLSIYHEGSKREAMEQISAALPYMDTDMRELAKRTLSKADALTEEEYCVGKLPPDFMRLLVIHFARLK